MLKLLLGHWQSHREPLPFVLTDDPLYCAHLTTSTSRAAFPEVYSVNRVNPIFEEDETTAATSVRPEDANPPSSGNQFRTFPAKRKPPKTKSSREEALTSNFELRKPVGKSASNAFEYSSRPPEFFDSIEDELSRQRRLRRSSSDEAETKSSDDTGYSSAGCQPKSLSASDGSSSADQPMSSDSDDCPRPEAVVVVSADVHRESTAQDVLVRSPSSESSANYSYRSYGSSPEPFDSLTMSSSSSSKDRRTHSAVKDRLQRLLEKGNDARRTAEDLDMQRTKSDLMKSLTRALNSKVPKQPVSEGPVTRSDDSKSPDDQRPHSAGSSTSPKALLAKASTSSESSVGVTRQDESTSSSLSSFPKPKKQQHKHRPELEKESSDSSGRRCKVCENARRPLAFHQLLPGHWSYDNVYLPQVVCPCMHHHLSHHLDDVFLPPPYHQPRSRHSWALATPDRHDAPPNKDNDTTTKHGSNNNARYSPDGETDSSSTSKRRLPERRSLRESKSCHCLGCLPEKTRECSCQHRKMVKFASETDISRHRHLGAKSDPVRAALVMGLPHLNGQVAGKGGKAGKQEKATLPPPLMPPFVPRGMKEPIKMEELYGAYPINFRDWESHYRRNFLRKRKKRALAMVGMAIGIVMVVGVAVALTFVFLRIRRPAS